MAYLILASSILSSTISSSLDNEVSKGRSLTRRESLFFTFVKNLSACFVMLLLTGIPGRVSGFTVGMGIVFGITIAANGVLILLAFASGPMNYTVLISSASAMLIPIFVGVLVWGETVSLGQIAGIVLMLVSFVLCIGTEKGSGKKAFRVSWLVYTLLGAVLSGLMGVWQKLFQKVEESSQMNVCLTVAMFLAAVIPFLIYLFSPEKETRPSAGGHSVKWIGTMAVSGVLYAAVHRINFYLAGAMPAAIFFPVNSGCCILASILCARLFFHEKMSPRQAVGVAVGIAAVLLLSNVGDLLFLR